MNTIAIEDIMTVVLSDFVKKNKEMFKVCPKTNRMPYMKLNYAGRRKLTEKFLENYKFLGL